jgi:hypothetical protein
LAILLEHGYQLGVVTGAPSEKGIVWAILGGRTPWTDYACTRCRGAAVIGAIDQNDIRAQACQVIGGAGAQDAGAYHDNSHAVPSVACAIARPVII